MATRLIFTLTVGFLLVGAQGGWQSAFSQPNPSPTAAAVVVAQEKTTAAIVEDVDPQARHVLLRLPDDTLVTLKVGPEVRIWPRSSPAITSPRNMLRPSCSASTKLRALPDPSRR